MHTQMYLHTQVPQQAITFEPICTNFIVNCNLGSTTFSRSLQSVPGWQHRAHRHTVPVDTRALNAQQNAQVDTGPARIRLTTVTALVIPGYALHSLQDGLSFHTALPGVGSRINAASRWGSSPVQSLQGKKGSRILRSTVEQTRALHSRGTDRKHYLKKNKLGLVQEGKG